MAQKTNWKEALESEATADGFRLALPRRGWLATVSSLLLLLISPGGTEKEEERILGELEAMIQNHQEKIKTSEK